MSHIPLLSISDFFQAYRLGQPLHPEIMCMRLEDQPDTKLMAMPLYRSDFFRVIQFTDAVLTYTTHEKRVSVEGSCLSFSYPGKLESWEREGRLYGTVIYFSQAFAHLDTTHSGFNQDYPYFTFEGDLILNLDQREAWQLRGQAQEMIKEMYSDLSDKLSMIEKLLALYLHTIRRLYVQKMGAQPSESKSNQAWFNRFRKATEDYFGQLAQGEQRVILLSPS
ncbi:hypothetical protein GXP67_31615 [Rhodocytophaga rosea]|uniref:AraC family transcriptional regulator n=1 Tax=Rhodocytophaga rosea TaxID=2704465 RepID=A0A6C0GH75_9BACT|nr:hypothetical protein [Rhodocytophaga rosea]QHT67348.1 hypothetical protein GXP67_12235 [Rhodocytophaga rosea]QHT70874.1 hypothetical protein GXP67_31615 [Rhodocytophaga rosea]